MSSQPKKIVFVFPARMTAGGMPDDTRHFISAVSEAHDGPVVLLSQGEPVDSPSLLGKIDCVNLDVPGAPEKVFDSLAKHDVTVFITFSSLLNVRLAKQLRLRGLRYSVLPAWQVHEFLDWDRPFARDAVPTIQSSEKNAKQFNTAGKGGVVEGRITVQGFLRSIRRKTYRRTLGKTFLQNASGIHVYSDFEKAQILRLVAPRNPNFLDIAYGTDVEGRTVGDDRFPDDGRKNIVFWGRADYFYKGLDTIIDGIALAIKQGVSAPFTFWVCGPDYNNGYKKLRDHIGRANVSDYVRILEPGDYTPGTIGFLKHAQFSILASRWDGYARALRESAALGVPFISNRQSHFDGVVAKFGNGLLFDDVSGLAEILADLDSPAITEVQRKAKIKAQEFKQYISWPECASRFLCGLAGLRPAT